MIAGLPRQTSYYKQKIWVLIHSASIPAVENGIIVFVFGIGKEENGMKKDKQVMTSTGVAVREKPLKLRIWNNRDIIYVLTGINIVLIVNYWPMLGIRTHFMIINR